MARLESVAVGGYYPTPPHLVDLIANMLDTEEDSGNLTLMDPCAGEGSAVIRVADLLPVRTTLYTCEMEGTRFQTLRQNLYKAVRTESTGHALEGDAFQIEIPLEYVSGLYLNPPYDTDPLHGRLEQRFLERFTRALIRKGILIFIVPHYALKASADLLATQYGDLRCFRFPEEDFAAYRQVVLMGRKIEALPFPDPKQKALVESWAQSADALPVLGKKTKPYTLPEDGRYQYGKWKMREMDLTGLVQKARPWQHTTRTGTYTHVPHVLPQVPVEDLMFRTFPIATSPRPAHIAAGIASGLFNGRRVTARTPGFPDLLVKGVFDREYVTIEEKINREGEVSAVVQVQQPKLVTTVLDLSSQKYATLKLSGKSDTRDVADMSIEDLLEHYGPSLMQVMAEQCPVAYDAKRDADSLPLAPIARDLYRAQDNAARALTQLLGGSFAKPEDRKGKAAILLGEIGSGKTAVVLTVGQTIAKRMLVMCPPHLLDSWRNETRKVLPDAEFRVLENISDVDALKDVPKDRFLVAIVSREAAKLGHGWEAVEHRCPKCGSKVPEGDLAKTRSRCEVKPAEPTGVLGKAATQLALKLAPSSPNVYVRQVLRSRFMRSCVNRLEAREDRAPWKGMSAEWIDELLPHVVTRAIETNDDTTLSLLGRLLALDPNPTRIERLVLSFKAESAYYLSDIARGIISLLPPGCDLQNSLRQAEIFTRNSYGWSGSYDEVLKHIQTRGYRSRIGEIKWTEEGFTLDDVKPGTAEMATALLANMSTLTKFHVKPKCGEPLFQATPEPRRYPLARYIKNRFADFFDFLVLDEGHEYATDGSAQERSAHRLTALGIPTVLMTGSIMNGYAESLFMNMWSLSRDFRTEFNRTERPRFVERYGYRKRIVSEKDSQTGKPLEFGTHTDRVERSERNIGDAPGILPLFLFRHLLPISVTLHKADLAIDLPPCRQIKELIQPDADLLKSYNKLKTSLLARIRKDQFTAGLAGKLFGALAELPSYLDRSTLDTGNQEDGTYQIRYPDSVGGDLVATGDSFPAQKLSTKEQWMLDTIRAELAENRNVMVFSWHVQLLPRLARIISQELGEEVPILYADKVPTKKREEWINKMVVRPGRRILVANPVGIQTGLNNLVHFCTEIWMENPVCNPIIFRQAIGRVDRIGQDRETRIYVPIFAQTVQVQLNDLLLRKVAVSISTDGLDPESMLLAAGASEDGYLSGLSIGKQLWNMLNAN